MTEMSAVALWLRSEARARWRAWLGLALVLGIAAGAVVAAAAGARRTDTAYHRFLTAQNAADITLLDDGELGVEIDLDELSRVPQVASVARGSLLFYSVGNHGAVAAVDDRLGRTINRLKVLEGRMYEPRKAEEIVVGFGVARVIGLKVGSTFPLYDPEELAAAPPEFAEEAAAAAASNITLKVVGIVAGPGEFPPQYVGISGSLHMTPAFFARYGNEPASGDAGAERGTLFIRLKRGASDVPAFRKAAAAVAPGQFDAFRTAQEMGSLTQRSFHFQALGLWLLAAFGAIATTLVLGQALARQAFLGSTEFATLRALGVGRPHLLLIGVVRAGIIALIGAGVAVLTALALSPVAPIGDARIAEPDPGLAFDATAIGVGAASLIVMALITSAFPAWRAARAPGQAGTAEPDTRGRPSSVAVAAERTGMSAPVVAGARMALEAGRGRHAVPVRSTLAGVVVGIGVLAAALTFGSSLDHLLDTPELYGVRWDTYVTNYGFGPDLRPVTERLRNLPGVSELAIGSQESVEIGGESVPFVAATAIKGNPVPPILDGRFPADDDEIALGTRTLRRLRARIGDRVAVRPPFQGAKDVTYTVVGRTVIPPSGFSPAIPGEGALLTLDGMARGGRLAGFDNPDLDDDVTDVFVRFSPGANEREVIAAIAAFMGAAEDPSAIVDQRPDKPADIISFGRVQNLPLLLGLILGFVAAGTLTHTVASSVRRRRTDLAILKTLGFVKGQVRRTVAWQATILVGAALAVGLPAGVAFGRWLWTVFADQLGMVPEASVRATDILLVVPAALLLANAIAAIPGRAAARVRPALVLRTE